MDPNLKVRHPFNYSNGSTNRSRDWKSEPRSEPLIEIASGDLELDFGAAVFVRRGSCFFVLRLGLERVLTGFRRCFAAGSGTDLRSFLELFITVFCCTSWEIFRWFKGLIFKSLFPWREREGVEDGLRRLRVFSLLISPPPSLFFFSKNPPFYPFQFWTLSYHVNLEIGRAQRLNSSHL